MQAFFSSKSARALLIDEQAWELPAAEACLARIKADAAEMAAAYG